MHPIQDKDNLVIDLIKGVEGLCVVLNDRRIVGPKPWGGGKCLHSWKVSRLELEEILAIHKEHWDKRAEADDS